MENKELIEKLKAKKFNLMITGTPGTGKTTLSIKLAEYLEKNHLNISQIAIKENLTDEYDDVLDSHYIDEDKV